LRITEFNNNFICLLQIGVRALMEQLLRKVPNIPGNHKAVLMGKLKLWHLQHLCTMSAAFRQLKKMILLYLTITMRSVV
jgi:hypothetical protein